MRLFLALFAVALLVTSCGKGTPGTPVASDPEPAATVTEEQMKADSLQRRAEKGDVKAMYDLGVKLDKQGDLQTAVSWYMKAGDKKHADGAYRAGVSSQVGRGCAKDMVVAKKYLQIAADAGHPKAGKKLMSIAMNESFQASTEASRRSDLDTLDRTELVGILQGKAAEAVTEYTESDELAQLVKVQRAKLITELNIPDKFADGGTAVLEKQEISLNLEAAYAKVDIDKAVADAFTDEKLKEVEAKAIEESPGYVVGERIQVTTRRGVIEGRLRQVDASGPVIDTRQIPLSDLSKAEWAKFDMPAIEKKRKLYVQRHFYAAKQQHASKLKNEIKERVLAESGYIEYNGKWVPADKAIEKLVEPEVDKYRERLIAAEQHKLYERILKDKDLVLLGDKVISIDEKTALVKSHTDGVEALIKEVGQMLRKDSSTATMDKAILMAGSGLKKYPLAKNVSVLMSTRDNLMTKRRRLAAVSGLPTGSAPPPRTTSTTKQKSNSDARSKIGSSGFKEYERTHGPNDGRNRNKDDRNNDRRRKNSGLKLGK
jgi:hypothetical protein